MSKKRILVADDYLINRSALKSFLISNGFEVDGVEDGAKGVELLDKNKYDLIFSDIEMPNMNGYEFLTAIRKHSLHKATPVIMLSSLSRIDDINRAKKLGANHYIVKPYTTDKLKDALKKVGF